MSKTFFFYDLETSGLDARNDRIMQFAGQRTDMDLKPVGEPVNFLIKLGDDVLPSPWALLVTGISPQKTLMEGISEAEAARFLQEEVFTPDTIAVGYNSVRFDDEFMRYFWWRNFWDAYEWSWKEGRSRWDLLDVVRLTRALRPDGIKWPVDVEGKATNKLELLTKLNGLEHKAAHDAMSDVTALIQVAGLIRNRQSQLFEYLLKMRDKNEVKKLVNLDEKREFVYASGRYSGEFNKTTVAFPLTSGRNGNVVVYDLRYDPEKLMKMSKEKLKKFLFEWRERPSGADAASKTLDLGSSEEEMPRTVIKEMQYNRCPAIAPLSVLEKEDGWKKLGLSAGVVARHKAKLLADDGFSERVRSVFEERPEFVSGGNVEERLYDGFLNDKDRVRVEAVRNADENALADFNPDFADERLGELLTHYKARNFPHSLSEDEAIKWEKWRGAKIMAGAGVYAETLQKLAASGKNNFMVEELQLWLENVMPGDF